MRQLIYGMAIALAVTFTPMLAEASNQKMVESVANMLQSSDLAEGCDIGLKYQNNTIWLTGTVPSEAKRVAIEACVFHVKGVDKVVNELKVTAATEEADQEVSATIEDSDVQAAAYQRSILRNRPLLRRDQCQPYTVGDNANVCVNPNNAVTKPMLASRQPQAQSLVPQGARVISDEVVSVEPMVGLTPTTPVVASHAPAVGSNYPVVMPPAQPVAPQVQVMAEPQMPAPQAMNHVPMRQVNYTVTNAVPVATQYQMAGAPLPMNSPAYAKQSAPSMRYDQPHLPRQAWPSYASYPNTAAVQYPKRYCAKAWPFIGPFYPYPQVPDGWRKVTLEWHDGYWHLDFDDGSTKGPCRGLFRMNP